MGSPALEAMSPNSTVRRIRKADAVGRLRARTHYYLWFSGQIHAKVSFGAGLFLWSLRAIRMRFYAISHARVDDSILLLTIESFRFVFLPCALVWAVYLYFIYGCILGFVFVYRRSQQTSFQRNRTGTVNSASWSFKVVVFNAQVFADRSSVVTNSSEGLNIKQGFFSRLSIGNHSWHSYKCTDNPTLRSYKKKEDRSLSLLSEDVNVSLGLETSENNNLSRSFCGFNSSHRALDTVHEENESQGNTLIGSEECATPNDKTRM
ncbi:hypothetical protein GCK32_014392 [Trichostrongylus colubriformis]|uniref:Uncharacterized protein n=1 Tax=Trichostrongylus colubriformis TaxID=6319 RepID=A0AAN8IJE9_TRICO